MDQPAARLMETEVGVAPLFVIGDVNEDGVVDAADLALMEKLAAGQSPAAATCPAAADPNMDGKVDATDLEIMRRMLVNGSVAVPALNFQFKLPCGFKRLRLAARPSVNVGESDPVYSS